MATHLVIHFGSQEQFRRDNGTMSGLARRFRTSIASARECLISWPDAFGAMWTDLRVFVAVAGILPKALCNVDWRPAAGTTASTVMPSTGFQALRMIGSAACKGQDRWYGCPIGHADTIHVQAFDGAQWVDVYSAEGCDLEKALDAAALFARKMRLPLTLDWSLGED